MPRNRYTQLIRKGERNQVARQQQEIADIAKDLARKSAASIPASAINETKARRSVRLAHKRKHKPMRFSTDTTK